MKLAPPRPRARFEAAATRFAAALASLIEEHTGSTRWVDQNDSPLGKRRHLEAVRRGDLQAFKEGRRVLVREDDIDDYLRRKTVEPSYSGETVEDVLRDVGLRTSRPR